MGHHDVPDMIMSLIATRNYEKARILANSLRMPSRDDFRALLILFRDLADVEAAERLFRRMKLCRIQPDSNEYVPKIHRIPGSFVITNEFCRGSFHVLMSLYAYCGLSDKVCLLLRDLQAAGVSLLPATLKHTVEILTTHHSCVLALKVFSEAIRTGTKLPRSAWEVVMLACVRERNVDAANALLGDLLSRGMYPSPEWFKDVCQSCAAPADYPILTEVWRLLASGPELPYEMWLMMTKIARERGDSTFLIEAHEKMRDLALKPSPLHFTTLLRYYADDQRDVRRMLELHQEFRNVHLEFELPGSISGAMVKACAEVALGEGLDVCPRSQPVVEGGIRLFRSEVGHQSLNHRFAMHDWASLLYGIQGHTNAAVELVEQQVRANLFLPSFAAGCTGVAIAFVKQQRWRETVDVFHKYIWPHKKMIGAALFSLLCLAAARSGDADSALKMLRYALTQTDLNPREDAYVNIFIACAQDARLGLLLEAIEMSLERSRYHFSEYVAFAAMQILRWFGFRTPKRQVSIWTISPSSSWGKVAKASEGLKASRLSLDQISWLLDLALPIWRQQLSSPAIADRLEENKMRVRDQLDKAGFASLTVLERQEYTRRQALRDTLLELVADDPLPHNL